MFTTLLLATVLQAVPAAPPAPDTEKKVCRRVVATGSIMPRTKCRTKAEWAALDTAATEAAEHAIDQRNNRLVGTR
jgi:hypothetical protein